MLLIDSWSFLFFHLSLNQRGCGAEVSNLIDTNSPLLPVCYYFEPSRSQGTRTAAEPRFFFTSSKHCTIFKVFRLPLKQS